MFRGMKGFIIDWMWLMMLAFVSLAILLMIMINAINGWKPPV
jgi:hypothetical protein